MSNQDLRKDLELWTLAAKLSGDVDQELAQCLRQGLVSWSAWKDEASGKRKAEDGGKRKDEDGGKSEDEDGGKRKDEAGRKRLAGGLALAFERWLASVAETEDDERDCGLADTLVAWILASLEKYPDPRLLRAFQKGRDEAFRCLVERYEAAVRRLFQHRGFAPNRREELTQETFLRVFNGMVTFRAAGAFRGWLFQVARNVATTARSQEQKNREILLEKVDDEQLAEVPAQGADVLEQLVQRDQIEKLRRLLPELTEKQRRYLELHLDGWTHLEIAEEMGVAKGTVKATLHQVKEKLKERLCETD